MFNKYIIEEGQRGLLYRDGKVIEYLPPGRHVRWGRASRLHLERLAVSSLVVPLQPDQTFATLVPEHDAVVLEVMADCAALIRRHGVPQRVVPPGRYLLFQVGGGVTVQRVGLTALDSEIPVEFRGLAREALLYEAIVSAHERAVLYVDGVLTRVLGPGRHHLSPWNRKLRLTRVDLREQELQVVGQELMTLDKVTLRLNLITRYRVIDARLLVETLDTLRDAVYAEAQLSARHMVAGVTVDGLLEQRTELAAKMIERVRARAKGWGVEILSLDVKDVILPGEMKALLNQVIEAEKRAAAQVILRREEVAATRSLANTARLLEQNPVLLKLKELEALKELAERIPKLTVLLGSEGLAKQIRLLEE